MRRERGAARRVLRSPANDARIAFIDQKKKKPERREKNRGGGGPLPLADIWAGAVCAHITVLRSRVATKPVFLLQLAGLTGVYVCGGSGQQGGSGGGVRVNRRVGGGSETGPGQTSSEQGREPASTRRMDQRGAARCRGAPQPARRAGQARDTRNLFGAPPLARAGTRGKKHPSSGARRVCGGGREREKRERERIITRD